MKPSSFPILPMFSIWASPLNPSTSHRAGLAPTPHQQRSTSTEDHDTHTTPLIHRTVLLPLKFFDMTSSYGEARLTGSPHANLADDLGTVSGLIVVFGLLAGIPGVRDLIGASAKNVDWEGDPDNGIFPPIIGLLANLVVVLFALASVFLGFQYLVGKWGSKLSALFGLGITLAAWFPFLVTIALISFQADHENITGPPLLISYPASKSEVSGSAVGGYSPIESKKHAIVVRC